MENKKGIRIKTKQASLVDNILTFFKKNDVPQSQQNNLSTISDNKDMSPRSTTPRKKIFQKTPEKAGKLKMNRPTSDINNKSMDAAYEVTFNEGTNANAFKQFNGNRIVSPSKKNINAYKPHEDTQFKRLILDTSSVTPMVLNTRAPEPKKTFLSQNPVPDKPINQQRIKSLQQQVSHYKKLIQQIQAENTQLKKVNHNLFVENQNLKAKLKQHQKSSHHKVQITQLQAPKSPFQKPDQVSSKNPNQQIPDKSKHLMKQSIPVLPQTPHEYDRKQKSKLQEMSCMSSNMKSNHSSSFLSDKELNTSNMSNNNKFSHNVGQRLGENAQGQILSPLMEKTVYDKTTRPRDKMNREKQLKSNLSSKEQVTFSKTVGYIKGDQPQRQVKNNNPFQQIASQSNKFMFNNNVPSPSIQSFKVVQNRKGPTRQWLVFNQSQSSLQYSNNTSSYGKCSNPFDKNERSFEKDRQRKVSPFSKNKEKSNVSIGERGSFSKQQSVSNKLQIEDSKTYKFEDFNIDDEGASDVQFF